jgi:cellulose synthase/poly-beta-1,6-N-acetylglucosamine synthase-like glycosyltransferase
MIHSLLSHVFVTLQPLLCVLGIVSWLFVYSMIVVTPLIMYRRYSVGTDKHRRDTRERRVGTTNDTLDDTTQHTTKAPIRQRNTTKEPKEPKRPLVSILRPLKGLDTNLALNLESTFQQHYPHFELIFCLESALDPAYEIVQELMIRYPQVQARIVLGMFVLTRPTRRGYQPQSLQSGQGI